jgi:hypothetical protein
MSKFELWSLIISALGVLTVWIGFIFAVYQIRAALKQIQVTISKHKDDHSLQRKLAAQSAVNEYAFSNLSAELHKTFGYVDSNAPITIEAINKKFAEDDNHRVKLLMLLRHYESIARGINHGIYDEEVVKAALRKTFIRFVRAFSLYIEERRNTLSSPTQWIELTSLAEVWSAKDKEFQIQAQTGNLES